MRQDYDAGRGGWGAQAQKERREEVVYEQQTGAAGGGGDWKQGRSSPAEVFYIELTIWAIVNENPLKRQREEDDDVEPQVSLSLTTLHCLSFNLFGSPNVYETTTAPTQNQQYDSPSTFVFNLSMYCTCVPPKRSDGRRASILPVRAQYTPPQTCPSCESLGRVCVRPQWCAGGLGNARLECP